MGPKSFGTFEKRVPEFFDLEGGWALIRGERLFEAWRFLNFHLFHKVVDLFCNETINKNKRDDVPKQ